MSSNHPQHSTAPNDDEIDLTELFDTLLFHKWRIALVTAIFGMCGALYALSSTPVYQADAMLEVSGSKNQILGPLSELMGTQNTPADTEIELIKSRLILGKAVNELNLDTVISPKLSFLGKLQTASGNPPHVEINSFAVSPEWQNKPFTLITHGSEEYTLVTPDGNKYNGQIGKLLSAEGIFSLSVKQIHSKFGQEFHLSKLSMQKSIEQLRSNLSVAAKGKNLPIIGLTLSGTNRELISRTLDSIINHYTGENRNKAIQTAQNGLKFINEELPRLHEELQAAEDKLNSYRSQNKSLDVPSEARGTLDSLNKIEMQIVDLKAEESVMAEVYTKDHPAYKSLQDKLKVLNDAKQKLNKQITRMPETQQEIIRLSRNVEINQAIYMQLLNKQQELGILQASSQGNVRLIDQAVTAETPIKPKKSIITALATLIGLFLACGFYLMKSLLHRSISSEAEVEALGVDVLASIPRSLEQEKRDKALRKTEKGKGIRSNYLLSVQQPDNISVEALRALRTNLYFTGLDSTNKVIMISGATPEVGKSFIATNLAVLMAQSGQKVLLVDADMRKGYLHHLLQTENQAGLPNLLNGNNRPAHYQKIIQKTAYDGLHFISRGPEIKNPAEVLLNGMLGEFLAWAEKEYDHIILDTPPVLAVTDAAIIGQHAGMSLLVSRFGKTSIGDIEASLNRFNNSKIKISGIVLNGIERTAKNAYKYDYYRSYSNNQAA